MDEYIVVYRWPTRSGHSAWIILNGGETMRLDDAHALARAIKDEQPNAQVCAFQINNATLDMR